MEFDGFDWDGGNRDKCRKQGLTRDEIERRWRAIGTTASGRKVFVTFTLRDKAIRPIGPRYMHRRLPEALLNEVRARAGQAGMPTQRFIRLAIEDALQRESGKAST